MNQPEKDLREVEKDPPPEGVEDIPTDDLRSATPENLRVAWENAESKVVALSNEYTEKRAALSEEYEGRLQEGHVEIAEAQKAYLDAVVAEDLSKRDDGEVMARVFAAQGDPGPARVMGIETG
jgi:hypothetical protein